MKNWKFWLGVLVSMVFLYLAVYKLDLQMFLAELPKVNALWIVPGVLVYFIGLWVRAWRWHYLLRPLKAISTRNMFPIVTIGYAGNNIYPARAGEVVRAVILKRKEGVPVSASLATIIVERIFDGVVMLAFVFVNLPELARLGGDFTVLGNFSIQDIALGGTLVFVGALLVFLVAAMFPTQTEKILAALLGRFLPVQLNERILGLARRFLGGLASLRSPLEALMVFLTSLVIWLLETLKYWFVMHAFQFEVSFFTLMLMNGVVNLATTIPAAPGYIGTFDLPGIAVLQAYGVPHAEAALYTFMLHIALWLPVTLLGLYYMAREGIRWNQEVARLDAVEEAG